MKSRHTIVVALAGLAAALVVPTAGQPGRGAG